MRCPNGLWFSHSLPTDDWTGVFDFTVFERSPLVAADYKRLTGPVYQLIWGRKFTPLGVKLFTETVGVKLAITGHQPQELGYAEVGEQSLIVDSSHNGGLFLAASTSEEYDMPKLIDRLRPIAELGWEEE